MLTEPRKINVLGTDIRVEFRTVTDDPKLIGLGGYFDYSEDLIVVKIHESDPMSVGNVENVQKMTLRHELIHAFLYQSGLDASSCTADTWATNEEMVDWFALQSPKIFQVFKEQELI